MAMNLGRAEDSVFLQVLGESRRAVEDAVIGGELIGETSLDRVAKRLAELLGTNRGQTLKLVGVSRTKMSRNPKMDVEILDRIGSALKLYARIAAMVGPDGASRWLNGANRQLGGNRPVDLMATHLGHERVEEVVTALEDGTFL